MMHIMHELMFARTGTAMLGSVARAEMSTDHVVTVLRGIGAGRGAGPEVEARVLTGLGSGADPSRDMSRSGNDDGIPHLPLQSSRRNATWLIRLIRKERGAYPAHSLTRRSTNTAPGDQGAVNGERWVTRLQSGEVFDYASLVQLNPLSCCLIPMTPTNP